MAHQLIIDILNDATTIGSSLTSDIEQPPATASSSTTLLEPRRVLNTDTTPKEVTLHKGPKTMKKPTKRRTWKKPEDKPKRPLSAYNLFFKNERERIVHSDSAVSISSNIVISNGIKKRRHRKTHGKIGFADLARNIAEKWKNLDEKSKYPFKERAAVEKLRYQAQLEAWNKSQETKKINASHVHQLQHLPAQQQHLQQPNSVAPFSPRSCDKIGSSPLLLGTSHSASPVSLGASRSAPVASHSAPSLASPMFSKEIYKGLCGMDKPVHSMSLHECLDATQRTIEMATAVLNNPMMMPGEAPPQEKTQHFGNRDFRSVQQTLQDVQQMMGSPTSPPIIDPTYAELDFPDFHPVDDVEPLRMPAMEHPNLTRMHQKPHTGSESNHNKLPTDGKLQDILLSLDELDASLDDDFVDFLTEFQTEA